MVVNLQFRKLQIGGIYRNILKIQVDMRVPWRPQKGVPLLFSYLGELEFMQTSPE